MIVKPLEPKLEAVRQAFVAKMLGVIRLFRQPGLPDGPVNRDFGLPTPSLPDALRAEVAWRVQHEGCVVVDVVARNLKPWMTASGQQEVLVERWSVYARRNNAPISFQLDAHRLGEHLIRFVSALHADIRSLPAYRLVQRARDKTDPHDVEIGLRLRGKDALDQLGPEYQLLDYEMACGCGMWFHYSLRHLLGIHPDVHAALFRASYIHAKTWKDEN